MLAFPARSSVSGHARTSDVLDAPHMMSQRSLVPFTETIMRHRSTTLAVIALVATVGASAVDAQAMPSKPVPTDTSMRRTQASHAEMAQSMEGMLPFATQMMKGMMEARLEMMLKPETVSRMATFAQAFRDALLAKGFNREEAIRLTAATMGSLDPMKGSGTAP